MVTVAKGFFHHETISAYLTEYKDEQERHPKYNEPEVLYYCDPEKIAPLPSPTVKVSSDGKATIAMPPDGECLCMDVGSWTGRGEKSAANHERHREFGVVLGKTAFLCRYFGRKPDPGESFHTPPDIKDVKETVGYKTLVKPLLEYLSKSKKLGPVEVIQAMAAHDPRCTKIDNTLRIFLGDLHLPIVTQESEALVAPGLRSVSPNNNESAAALLNDQFAHAGRLNCGPRASAIVKEVRDRIKEVVSSLDDWRPGSTLGPLMDTLADYKRIKGLLQEFVKIETLDKWSPSEDAWAMSRAEAQEWFGYYSGKDGNKGAEIFQNAAEDLEAFVDLVCTIPESLGRVDFIQLGDFYDFWIGMKLGFNKRLSTSAGSSAMVSYWRQVVRSSPKVGKVVRRLEELERRERPNLRVKILYGNHDNYMRLERKNHYQDEGGNTVWAEHGHQSDSFNCDEDACLGWALTQTAFFESSVRALEDPLSSWWTWIQRFWSMAFPSRLQRMAQAAEVCGDKRKLIYVMAHTHMPLLRKIKFSSYYDPVEVCEHAMNCYYKGPLDKLSDEIAEYRDFRQLDANTIEAGKADARRLAKEWAHAVRGNSAKDYELQPLVSACLRAAGVADPTDLTWYHVRAAIWLKAAEKEWAIDDAATNAVVDAGIEAARLGRNEELKHRQQHWKHVDAYKKKLDEARDAIGKMRALLPNLTGDAAATAERNLEELDRAVADEYARNYPGMFP